MDTLPLESLRLTHVRVPLHEPLAGAGGPVSEKHAVLVELKAAGLTGLGEASLLPGAPANHPSPDSTWRVMTERLVPLMSEARELDLEGEWFAGAVDDPHATCGLDLALWDLAAKRRGVPLWTLLGGRGERVIESGLTVGPCAGVDELIERIDRHLRADGYRRVKIEIRPGWDAEPLEAVRIRFGRLPVMADAGGGYTREDLPHLAALDRFGLMMIEQPFARDDLEAHAELATRCRTPMALSASAESPSAVRQALRRRAARVIAVRPQRLGGLAAALRVHDLAAEAHAGCWMGSLIELGVGAHAAIHFATLANVVYPADIQASHRWFAADLTEPAVGCHNGALQLPPGAGLGVKLHADLVRRYKVRDYTSELNCRVRTGREPTDS